ncbi:MBL fold metallo-hydrolase [Amycolatopsis jiangsuensis]|uniref:Glyoxylase-like metal-dependent hydrolase (Beta-lactamase superfamily II) n=1 Tax=Amycolatopsis jiangsuensis TaxID=1181879 RepID=A0A840IWE8_9PSEU|nr:MBL fold metallo-hydrolase [Amycolatopsis jiangsuensis]MBB4685532.1 glyoxylase-like metal-dependent hydrolase (beta-lactamase superfamily II) [Amycolatopsis jiangsuensis]
MEPLPDGSNSNWAEPGIYEVAAGVYRIPLPLPNDALRAVNVYAVTDGSHLVLVDSGWALDEARRLLADALQGIGAELGDIREFLVTHVHRDHYTQAVALRREFGTKVALGKLEEPSLKASSEPERFPMHAQIGLLRQSGGDEVITALSRMFGESPRHTEAHLWEDPDEWLSSGRRVVLPGREFDVIHTPGHTNGHVVFLDDAAGLLFSGDHVLPHITPSIGFQPVPTKLPLSDYLDSLRLVREMPDQRMLPAHGPVTDSVHARIDELLEHHAQRLETMTAQVVSGASTAFQAATRMSWTRRERKLSEMDAFNQMLAVLETGAHLDVLASQGRLLVDEIDGVRHYKAT